jgi:hypothetical protein
MSNTYTSVLTCESLAKMYIENPYVESQQNRKRRIGVEIDKIKEHIVLSSRKGETSEMFIFFYHDIDIVPSIIEILKNIFVDAQICSNLDKVDNKLDFIKIYIDWSTNIK